jgi:hypothetical protein
MTDAAAKMQAKVEAILAKPEEKTLHRLIVESSLYEWNATARFLLCEIAVMRMDEDSNYPKDAPEEYQADKVDWCWLSQGKLALRIGKSESQVQRLITKFREDGTILYRDWYDENMTHHAEYKVVGKVFAAFQRPNQDINQERPRRNKEKRKPNAGSFSTKNQPGKSAQRKAIEAEDEE